MTSYEKCSHNFSLQVQIVLEICHAINGSIEI